MNIKLVEDWKKECNGACSRFNRCNLEEMNDCIKTFLAEKETEINEQIAQAVKDAYRKGQQSIDTKANLPDAG